MEGDNMFSQIIAQNPRVMPIPVREVTKYLKENATCYPASLDKDHNFSWENVDWQDLSNPHTTTDLFICVEISIRAFNDWAKWWPVPIPKQDNHPNWNSTLTMWINGMQKYIVGSVQLLVNPELGRVVVNYCVLNNREDFTFLGILDPEHKFTKLVVNRARLCMRDFIAGLSKPK